MKNLFATLILTLAVAMPAYAANPDVVTNMPAPALSGVEGAGKTYANYLADVRAAMGSTNLTASQLQIVELVYGYSLLKWKKGSIEELSADQYGYTVDLAAKKAKSKVIRAAVRSGRWGEKLLKAIIVTAEDFGTGFDKYVNEKAAVYDARHGKKN